MAEYTYKQWEQTQDNDNLINNAACLRWQAGIELAGGSWSGSFEDGKDSITIDEFNALESQIQSKVSSYTPKNYDPSSTVQIVPGVDGWNKVEDGILKAVCEPDGVNRNWLQNTRSLDNSTAKIWASVTTIDHSTDSDGFGVRSFGAGASGAQSLYINTSYDWDNDSLAGKTVVFSCDMRSDSFTSLLTTRYIIFCVYGGSSSGNSWTRKYYLSTALSQTTGLFSFNSGEFVDNDWFRLVGTATVPSSADMNSGTENEYSMYRYGIQFYANANQADAWQIRKPKLEIADSATDWVDAMEDYGYGNSTTLSASPQSMPDDTEDDGNVAAPEVEEIE